MRLTDKIAEYDSPHPFYTFEFFPPRTDQGFENLIPRITRLAKLEPLAISITWGAGGSTRDRSIDLAGLTQSEYGIDTILHLTCTNMVPGMVDDALRAAKSRGIQNILALRGDPPRGTEQWTPVDSRFTHGVDLVRYIRASPEFSPHFCIGVGAYPEGHPDQETDEEGSLNFLVEKVDAGADFIVTQLFYDADRILTWLDNVRAKGITVPIIPNVMPIQTYSSFLRLIKLCGVKVPPSVMAALEPIRHDDQLVKNYGVELTLDIIQKITSTGNIKGIHFCTLNLEKSVQLVIEKLHWAGGSAIMKNKLIADAPGLMIHAQSTSSELVIDPTTATNTAENVLTVKQTLDPDPGRGELNNAATWDDFPNGRFGDYKSPAFGAQDQWGGTCFSEFKGLSEWGHPKSVHDLTALFLRYLHSELSMSPFSSLPLSSESLTILPHLEQLTKRGWWTVGSQPAVDGVCSTDEIFGWGPKSGYVFQKSFVEFFVEAQVLEKIEEKVKTEGRSWVHYFAANLHGDCRSNVPVDGRNAVTWGMFPGQEIVQTTIIERGSFLTWKDEAFSIWAKWATLYPPGSEENKLLNSVRRERWLVSIVHHDYKRPDALWTFLLDGEFSVS